MLSKYDYEGFLIEENETKPNHYVVNSNLVLLLVLILIWLINETGLFRVDKNIMRVSIAVEFVIGMIIQIIGRLPSTRSNPKTKYFILILMLLLVLVAVTTLYYHAAIGLILPMLLATQYHNKKLTWMAIIGSCVVALISPVLGNILHVWDQLYLLVMLQISGRMIESFGEMRALTATDILQTLFYNGFPKMMILLAFSPIAVAVTKTGHDNVMNQMQVMKLSETDQMTGILNRNSFEDKLSYYPRVCKESLTCVFCDVDGLHDLNNSKGHAEGDKLLKYCAEVLKEAFGDKDTFRIGGDEFVCFAIDTPIEYVQAKAEKAKSMIEERGYHISMGIQTQHFSESVNSLLNDAEKNMYVAKRNYYTSINKTRR